MSLNLETHFRKTFIRRLQRIPQNWIISVFLSINSWLMWFYLSAVVFQEPSAKWSVQAATCSLPTTPFRRKSRPALLFHYFFSIFSTWFMLYSRPMNTSLAFFPLQFHPSGRCARWSRLCTSVSHSHGSRFFFFLFLFRFCLAAKNVSLKSTGLSIALEWLYVLMFCAELQSVFRAIRNSASTGPILQFHIWMKSLKRSREIDWMTNNILDLS